MSPPTRPKYGPRREELMQLDSTYNREPQWPLGSRADFDMKLRLKDKDDASKPHSYGLVDAHNDSFGKYATSPAWSFRPPCRRGARAERKPGPGGYTPRYAPVKPRSPSAGFGSKGCRRGLEYEGSDSPGPGVYDCRGSLGGAAARMPGRGTNRAGGGASPGPGAYSPSSPTVCSIPNFGRPPEGRPRSAGPSRKFACVVPGKFGAEAPKYTMGVPRPDPVDGIRRLGGNYTQFGHHGK